MEKGKTLKNKKCRHSDSDEKGISSDLGIKNCKLGKKKWMKNTDKQETHYDWPKFGLNQNLDKRKRMINQ